jgi:hypothetical protein
MAPVQVVSITPESCVIHSYHVLDPLTISRRLWNVLPCFDGRPHAAVLAEIYDRSGLRLTPEFIGKMVDFRILEAVV